MTLISFPIAHSHPPVNLPSSVSFITLLLPQDDTPDVIPRHTMLRHAYHVSATRNFRPAPIRTPPSLRDLSPLPSPSSYALPPNCAPHHAWRGARPSGAREQDRQAVSTPHSLRSSPASFPYSPVSRETREDHPRRPKRESPTCARAARSFVAASVLAALVLRRSWGVSCRAAVVKGSVLACFT